MSTVGYSQEVLLQVLLIMTLSLSILYPRYCYAVWHLICQSIEDYKRKVKFFNGFVGQKEKDKVFVEIDLRNSN